VACLTACMDHGPCGDWSTSGPPVRGALGDLGHASPCHATPCRAYQTTPRLMPVAYRRRMTSLEDRSRGLVGELRQQPSRSLGWRMRQ
jgi:hypothetical protein